MSQDTANKILVYFKEINRLFVLTVLLPTFLSIIYFGIIASDVYISESRFLVRSPDRGGAPSPVSALLTGAGFSSSQDDSYSVQSFMLSRDALKLLNDKLDLFNAFGSNRVDIFSRFAGLDWWRNSFEDLYLYYQKKVDIQLDPLSSITTLTVRSYKAQESFIINEKLMDMGEERVNQLNELGRQDMIRFALDEVGVAESKAKSAAIALSIYRDQKRVIDPEKQTIVELGQVAALQSELIATKALLIQMQSFTKSNPQIPSLELRVKNLQEEIARETIQVTGGKDSMANKASEYQRLALERSFADTQLASTLVSLELARNEAQRKQLYLERIVQPSKPDKAMEPRRIVDILSTFVLGMIVWGILTMLIAGIKEHQD